MTRNENDRPSTTEQIRTGATRSGIGRKVKAGIALSAISAAGVTGAYLLHEQNQNEKHELRVEAQEKITGFDNKVYVLAPGVALRETPQGSYSNDPNMNNVITETDKPLVVRGMAISEEKPGWASFVLDSGEEITSLDDRSDEAVWINIDALDEQGFVSAYNIAPVSELEFGGTVAATVTNGGALELDGFTADAIGVGSYATDKEMQMLDFVINGD